MAERRSISLAEFQAELKAQGVDRLDLAFKCPLCKTIQSMRSFIRGGSPAEAAEKSIGFSCLGRITGAGSPRKEPDGEPCNWSLGGLLRLHDLEVIDDDGKAHPHFTPATAAEAQELAARNAAAVAHG
jgi:hypothetical protein